MAGTVTGTATGSHRPGRLFCFGLGYTARALARGLIAEGWRVAGTARGDPGLAAAAALGIEVHAFSADAPLADAGAALAGATHLLSSVPPADGADPVLAALRDAILAAGPFAWVGYLSATSVYGDRDGAEVDESTPPAPTGRRGLWRVAAERAWLDLWRDRGLPVHVFRLAGIYGPGRSAFDQLRAGTARRVVKPGHVFSRIHVDDIAAVLRASMAAPDPGAVYNVCDDEPAPSADVTAFAATLLGLPPPPAVPFEQAEAGMSPAARAFWADNRRVSNARMHRQLGVRLRYPTYREGLAAVLAAEDAAARGRG